MINAKTARILAKESAESVSKHAEEIGNKIEAAAREGRSELVLDHHFDRKDPYFVERECFLQPSLNSFQSKVVSVLEQHGYSAKIQPFQYRVGGGLGSMGEEPTDETGYRIVIFW